MKGLKGARAKSESAREPRPFWKRALFISAIPLTWGLLFLVLEGVLVLVGFGDDSRLFDTFEPGLVTDNPEYVQRFYSLQASSGVQRSNLFLEEKDPSKLRVFVVGGSTAQGFPYQRNHSFTAITQSALGSLGMNIEVLNLGNSAMTSYYLREVLPELPGYEPDLVVIYAGHNEYYGTPSSFTGGTHETRTLLLELKKYRSVQLLERLIQVVMRRDRSESESTLMERRFASALFPEDSTRDKSVADLFIRNLASGLRPLIADSVPVLVFEPVSNLISMPPFRTDGPDSGQEERAETDALDLYERLQDQLQVDPWNRAAWERVKDMDEAPFRARSVLIRELRSFVQSEPSLGWIPTADELERRAGYEAFGDEYFIDHLHFDFDGQILLASILAEAILDRFAPGDATLRSDLDRYFQDPERIKEDVHLTDVWEFMAYSRILGMLEREPFLSMPLAKSKPTLPESVVTSELFRSPSFMDALRDTSLDDVFYVALDHYRMSGDRDGWIRNMNAYVHLFPGSYQTHLAYGLALLEDDPQRYMAPAGSYFRRAYVLSGRSPEVPDMVRGEFEDLGIGAAWEGFRQEYLN